MKKLNDKSKKKLLKFAKEIRKFRIKADLLTTYLRNGGLGTK
jgi:hypothetical protein